MKVTTSCHWLLACLLAQGLPLDVAIAADLRPVPPATSPIQVGPVRASLPVSSTRLMLADEGPRYGHLAEGSVTLPFQDAVEAFKHGQHALAHAGFSAIVKQEQDRALLASAKAFLAELPLLENPAGRGQAEAIAQYRALIRLHPNDPNASRALWRIGDLYVEMGWFQEAIVAYEYATSRVIARADADRSLLSFGVILDFRGRVAEAEQAFETVRKRATDDQLMMRATLGQANALCTLQRKREAQPLYDLLYQRWPDLLRHDPQILQQYGELLADTDQMQRARAIDTLLYNLYPSSPYAGAALVRLGKNHQRLGLYKQAEMFYIAALTQYSGSQEAGIASMHLARMDQEASAASAGSFTLKKMVGDMMRGSRVSYLESSRGEALYKKIAKDHPRDFLGSEALFQVAAYYELQGATARALQAYLAVTQRAGVAAHDPWPQVARVRLAAMLKPRVEAALKAKNDMQVVTLFHSHGQVPEQHYAGTHLLLEVAEAHQRLGFSVEAARLYQILVRDRKAGKFHEAALIGLGESYLDHHDSSAARNVFESFRLQHPQSPRSMLVLRHLITAMLEQEDRRSAIRLMRRWLSAHPREPERGWMQLTLAKTLADDHQRGEAVAAFEEAERHKFIQSPSDRLIFADLLTTLKKPQQAVELYQRILASNPEPDQAEWARLQILRTLA
ncbi:MAG: tetratricopeptide repeat protein, partial [Nitrospirae bacterium]|nr:tetratricopeptide repeat protein [Nitrospirota bacterium]